MSFSCSQERCCQQEERAREEDFRDPKIGGGSPAVGSRMMCQHRLPGRTGAPCRYWLALCSTRFAIFEQEVWSKQSFLFYSSQNRNRVCQQVFAVNWMAQHLLEAGRKGWRTALWWKRQLFRNDCKLIEKANSLIIVLVIIVTNNFHQYWCIFLNLIWVRCKTLFYHLLATSASREQTAAQVSLPNCKYGLELHLLPSTPAVTPPKLGYMEVARQVKIAISKVN